jgi:hypothetical protein
MPSAAAGSEEWYMTRKAIGIEVCAFRSYAARTDDAAAGGGLGSPELCDSVL